MNIKRAIQLWLAKWLNEPEIPDGKTTGYSLVRSEKSDCIFAMNSYAEAPYFFQHVKVGSYSYFAYNAHAANVSFGKFCSIGPNFCCGLGLHPVFGLSTSFMMYSRHNPYGLSFAASDFIVEHEFRKHDFQEMRLTTVGNDVYIGANVTVLDGVTIGDGAVIGAGAVVTKDIPPYAIAVGVPAKVVKYRFDDATIKKLQEKQWWNVSEEELKRVAEFEFRVEDFTK